MTSVLAPSPLPLPLPLPRPTAQPIVIEPGNASPHKNAYSQHLRDGEPIRITSHVNGTDDGMNYPPASVYMRQGVFMGFRNLRTNHVYQTPSKYVQAHLPTRNGNTNQWAGPLHVLVERNHQWVQIKTFH